MSALRFGLIATLFVIGPEAQVAAHDFWVQPNQYWVSPATPILLTLQVGHGPSRQRSPMPLRRIVRFDAITPDGRRIDIRNRLRLGEPDEDGDLQFDQPGSYLVVLQTDDRAQTHLPAIRFNDYLRAEGLTPALDQRARLKRMDTDASESYSRCAKSIIQVGPYNAALQGQIITPVGLPLEIVPEASVYARPRAATLPVRVLYEGQPLAGALVKLTDLGLDDVPLESHVTDQEGRARFTVPNSGGWLLNVVWTKPRAQSDETDFETVFSSLSFGFELPRSRVPDSGNSAHGHPLNRPDSSSPIRLARAR